MTDERRRQIFIGLFHSVVKKGFSNCTISEIAKAANVSRGILHYYFKNKQDMLLELMRVLGNTHYEGLQGMIAETDDPREKLKGIVRFHYLDDSKPFHDTAGVWVEFWGQAPHDREVRAAVSAIQSRLRTLIADLIVEGMDKGVFRRVDPQCTASVIMSMMEGPTLQWCVDHKAVNIREISRTLEDFIAFYLELPSPREPGHEQTVLQN